MGIVTWIILGLLAGILAKWIMPGRDGGGLIITTLLGIAGAFVGGYVGSLFGFGSVNAFTIESILIATGGAFIILFLYRLIK
ncbi:GlsB/YeaQ/YmgE family stress response membrane protein [Zooshikella sp. RANM57]|uniref:GlsB/YeaQ/YmgE family stress response membrane protein n=1 Tax=Zooshikella sp. RANM57 TaxID=3425863 RepID=UPI003D6FAFBE